MLGNGLPVHSRLDDPALRNFTTLLAGICFTLKLLLLFFAALPLAGSADEGNTGTITINAEQEVVHLKGMPTYIDTTGALSLNEVSQKTFSKRIESTSQVNDREVLWLRFSILRPKEASEGWLLEVVNWRQRHLTYYANG